MKTVTIELCSLSHHLRMVAELYGANASAFDVGPEANAGLASQFRHQAAECRELADALDERQSVRFDAEADTLCVAYLPLVEVGDIEGLAIPDDRHLDHLEVSIEHPGALSNLPHDA